MENGSIAAESTDLRNCLGMTIFSINGGIINSLEDVAAFEQGCTEVELVFIPSSIPMQALHRPGLGDAGLLLIFK